MAKNIKVIDIISVLNILIYILSIFVSQKFILLSACMFLLINVLLLFEVHKKSEISLFRYIWSFIATSVGYSNGITLMSDIRIFWIIYIIVSLIYVYIVIKDKRKSIIAVLFYTLCLSTILHGMVIRINQSFDKSADTYITATIVHKQKNGDWNGENTFSQFDIYSPEYFENTLIGYQTIGMVGDRYNQYDIGDEIDVTLRKGFFRIKYCYIK